jgi:8-oxo-dGTP pyrophosphatase MutT (NUDIX family)
MPYRLNHVLFRPWKKAPADAEAWETLFGGGELEEDPPFENMGLQAAAGAVVVEPDGRVWLVAPTNGFGGSKVAFPKGRTNHMGLRTTALKEVYEESGLRVEILSHLIDVKAYDQDPGAQLERDLLPSLGAVRDFLASVLMGTQCLAFPDKTLKDFTYTPTQED